MKLFLQVFFDSDSWLWASATALYLVGLWAMLKKSGVPGWWALIPCAREYMLARCAEREPEGRITSLTSFAVIVIRVLIQLELLTLPAEAAEGGIDILAILILALSLIRLIYSIRVYLGLIEVYGRRRRWLWLWIPLEFIPALIWGFSSRFQPLWKVEDIRRELSDVTSSGMANILDDGLTVNLRVRKVREFLHMKTLIRDIHLSIPPGRMVLLLGGSGAGKTVFLNAICGYEKADASVLLGGVDIYRHYRKTQCAARTRSTGR